MTSDEQFQEWLLTDEGRTADSNLCYAPGGGVEYSTAVESLALAYHARDDELATLRAQIADLEQQHVGDKAIIEALNERVRELTQQLATINQMIGQPVPDVQTVTISDPSQLDKLIQLKRPPMTRELPKVEGWFWWEPDDAVIGPMSGIVRVVKSDGGQLLTVKWGTIFARTLFPSEWRGLWSARPIEMDPMPEGGE